MTSPTALFEKHVLRSESGCWEWHGAHDCQGYSLFNVWNEGAHYWLAHRFSFEQFTGKKIGALTIDHLCRNRGCVNPAHLEAVPHAVNVQRGEPATKTHCKNGHLFDDANTIIRRGVGRRSCRLCGIAASKRYYRKKLTSKGKSITGATNGH